MEISLLLEASSRFNSITHLHKGLHKIHIVQLKHISFFSGAKDLVASLMCDSIKRKTPQLVPVGLSFF